MRWMGSVNQLLMAMTPNGKRWLFIAFSETRITLWNPETSDVMNTFPNPSFMLTAIQPRSLALQRRLLLPAATRRLR